MSPLFMDTGYEPSTSPGSLSAEESRSNTAGSEKEGGGEVRGNRGTKRQTMNRDAARKSRKKQTERADELHEELQGLEKSNSAFQNEIAALKKEFHLYTKALENHEPLCCLRASGSSSANRLLAAPSTVAAKLPTIHQKCSSSHKNLPRTTYFCSATVPSTSTSLTSSSGCIENPHLSPSESSGMSSELFVNSSSSSQAPYFSDAPHSLFSEDLSSLITSRLPNATLIPDRTSLNSNPAPSAAARPLSGRECTQESSSNALFQTDRPVLFPSSHTAPSTRHSDVADAPLRHLVPGNNRPMNVPQLFPNLFPGNPNNSSPSSSLSASSLQYSAPPSLSVSIQGDQDLTPTDALKPDASQQMTTASLLSLLTVPSPLNVPQTSNSSFERPFSKTPTMPTLLGDSSIDRSLSELLEVEDWILNGANNS